jgi:hypothetical protein
MPFHKYEDDWNASPSDEIYRNSQNDEDDDECDTFCEISNYVSDVVDNVYEWFEGDDDD